MNLVEQSFMLSAENLGKKFGTNWVFRHLEFELSTGDCLIVLGANGTGKSTLLKVLAGIETPSEGKKILKTASTDERIAIGYTSPEIRLYDNLTAFEHMALCSQLKQTEINKKKLEKSGLLQFANKPVANLSTGMKARLKLMLAIQTSPTILLLDEPTLGLDPFGKEFVENVIHEQQRKGICVIASNDESERRFGNYEIRMDS